MANEKVEKAVQKQQYKKLEKMAGSKDEALAIEAIDAMGRVPGEDSFNYLTGVLRSPNAKVRAAAADGLGTMKDQKARAFLEHQLKTEQDPAVTAKIHEALASVRSK